MGHRFARLCLRTGGFLLKRFLSTSTFHEPAKLGSQDARRLAGKRADSPVSRLSSPPGDRAEAATCVAFNCWRVANVGRGSRHLDEKPNGHPNCCVGFAGRYLVRIRGNQAACEPEINLRARQRRVLPACRSQGHLALAAVLGKVNVRVVLGIIIGAPLGGLAGYIVWVWRSKRVALY